MMDRDAFENRVLQLWTTTRIALTRPSLQVLTEVPRKKLDPWLDELVAARVLELDSDDEGNALWKVPGATRSTTGPATLAEWQKLEGLRSSVALEKPAPARAIARVPDEKSVLASAGLSFVLGPFGWLYAAPLPDAVAGILVYLGLHWILPSFLFLGLLGVAQPVSALLGALYAWQNNKQGHRVSLKDMGRQEQPKRLSR